jgi:hypothetical protein
MFPVNASRFRQYRPIYIIIYVSYNMYMEQDSVVGIETSCELEGSGLRFQWGKEIFSFLHLSIPALGATQPPRQWVT